MKTLLCMALLAVFSLSAGVAQTAGPARAIQYDEIQRTVLPGSTPAPPAQAFATDFAQVKDGKLYGKISNESPSQQMMRPQFGLGSILGAIFNPMGALMSLGTQMLMGGIMGAMMGGMPGANGTVETGRASHVAYYGNTLRIENQAEHTVTLYDAKTRMRTQIDLVKHQYTVSAADENAQTMPQDMGPGVRGGGSADVAITVQHTQGRAASISGIDATEYDTVTNIALSNATGSCHNMNMRLTSIDYAANSLTDPAQSGQSFTSMFLQHPEMMAGPGCTAKVQMNATGTAAPPDALIVYSQTLMSMPEMEEMAAKSGQKVPQVWMVTERGNIRPVSAAEATTLFSVPAGFAQQPR